MFDCSLPGRRERFGAAVGGEETGASGVEVEETTRKVRRAKAASASERERARGGEESKGGEEKTASYE